LTQFLQKWGSLEKGYPIFLFKQSDEEFNTEKQKLLASNSL
jgi:hypothetical protein